MSISAASVLYVLNKLKDAIKKGKAIKEVRFDDQAVTSFKINRFELDIERLDLTMEFKTAAGATTTISALHYFRSDQPDVIKVNGDDAADDGIDMDVDIHLLRADVEYRLAYTQGGRSHNVFMLASIDWF